MTIARTFGALGIGASETSGSTLTRGGTLTGTEVDVLGGTDGYGDVIVHLAVPTLATGAGPLKILVFGRRLTGQANQAQQPIGKWLINPVAGGKYQLGRVKASRYMNAVVKDLGAVDATNPGTTVAVLYELEKLT